MNNFSEELQNPTEENHKRDFENISRGEAEKAFITEAKYGKKNAEIYRDSKSP
jgi:hypothetical protein